MGLGLAIVGGTLGVLGALIAASRILDRARGIDPDDKWSGWFRAKSAGAGVPNGPTGIYDGSGYDSMNDHGNRDADGGL